MEIPEYQGEPEEIVKEKLIFALDKVKGLLIVEDTSLCFNALNGMPGPYIKSFLSKLGPSGLNKMLGAYDDKTAYAQCIFGLAKNKSDGMKLFIGKTHGNIVSPKGPQNFGWDPIFQPNGFNKTYAELEPTEKNAISHRYKALKSLIDWLKSNPDYII
jgi:inosine triphosphate pyrophosphatase